MPNTKPKIAVFDIDGTIALNGKVLPEMVQAFTHLQKTGWITTICTGRGYPRAKAALGDLFETIVSPDALLLLEHGTKVNQLDGTVLYGAYFSEDEINHVHDFIRSNAEMVRFVWFNPPTQERKVQVWCKDASDISDLEAERGSYSDVYSTSFGNLRERLHAQPLSSLSIKLMPHIQVHGLKLNFTRTPIKVTFQDGNMDFTKTNTNKALSIDYFLKHHGGSHERLLVAGNSTNDVDMLNMPAAHRILVGDDAETDTIMGYLYEHESVTRLKNPQALAGYLQTL